MSVATEFAPTVPVPARARTVRLSAVPATVPAVGWLAEPVVDPGCAPLRVVAPAPAPVRRPADPALAPVAVLHPPLAEPRPLRLTQRGMVAVAVLVGLLALGLVWLARASAPQARTHRTAPHVVTVQAGDTLWAIATRVAPGADPQAEVDRLKHVNHLSGSELVPGQQLRVP